MSKELGAFLSLLTATVLLAAFGGAFAERLALLLRVYFAEAARIPLDPAALFELIGATLIEVGLLMAAPFAALFFAAIAAGMAQTGPLWVAEPLKPKVERISPISGFSRLFSLRSLVEFLKSLTKVALVSFLLWMVLEPHLPELIAAARRPVIGLAALTEEIAIQLLAAAAALMAMVAALDISYQRFELTKQLRMSKRDIQDEHKQSEGDPMIKQRLRALRMERARQRMIADVPKSTVVVTNPTHVAVALRWVEGEGEAPKVVAKGVDHLALRIRQVAQRSDVPVVENPPLARALESSVAVGEIIPPAHYRAVAEVIGFVFRTHVQKRENPSGPGVQPRSRGAAERSPLRAPATDS